MGWLRCAALGDANNHLAIQVHVNTQFDYPGLGFRDASVNLPIGLFCAGLAFLAIIHKGGSVVVVFTPPMLFNRFAAKLYSRLSPLSLAS